jgi:hypothetical protein
MENDGVSNIVYLHIPKAAGTSFRFFLERVYGEERVAWFKRDISSARKLAAE